MSYILEKPYTQQQKNDFIVKYNHNLALRIEENEDALYALENNEIFIDGKPSVDPDFEEKQRLEKRQMLNKLTLTKADFWIALLDRNITKSMVREKLALIPDEKLREKTLIRFDDAEKYWRGDESMNVVAGMFGIVPEELDYLFQNGHLPENLLPKEAENNE